MAVPRPMPSVDTSSLQGSDRALAIAQIATGVGISIFWLLFFTIGLAPARPPRCFFEYEHSFPLPDAVLAAGLIASGVDILRGGSWGRRVALACAGGLLFLGLVDLSFNVLNGGFSGPLSDSVQAGLISLWCIGLGTRIIGAQSLGRPVDPSGGSDI